MITTFLASVSYDTEGQLHVSVPVVNSTLVPNDEDVPVIFIVIATPFPPVSCRNTKTHWPVSLSKVPSGTIKDSVAIVLERVAAEPKLSVVPLIIAALPNVFEPDP